MGRIHFQVGHAMHGSDEAFGPFVLVFIRSEKKAAAAGTDFVTGADIDACS